MLFPEYDGMKLPKELFPLKEIFQFTFIDILSVKFSNFLGSSISTSSLCQNFNESMDEHEEIINIKDISKALLIKLCFMVYKSIFANFIEIIDKEASSIYFSFAILYCSFASDIESFFIKISPVSSCM